MTITRNGSPEFYQLIEQMAEIHNKKSHDYASNNSPFANYQFAGKLSQLFKNPDDAGFIGRIGEKLYRLANLENNGKQPSNEAIEDTEVDICVIIALWVASRRERRGGEGYEITEAQAEKVWKDTHQTPGKAEPTMKGYLVTQITTQLHSLNNNEIASIQDYITRNFGLGGKFNERKV